MSKTNKIKPYLLPQNSIKTISKININDDTPIIMFTHFNGYSVKINGFNNYYINSEKSIDAVCSFFEKIKIIQKMKISDLFNTKNKRQLHCHPIREKREIERINNVLLNGYNFPKETVDNFENYYFEFSLDNGSRVIFVKIDNIFELLFIDNNHMIYKESSRFLKHKETYEYPSCLGKINFEHDYDEKSVREVVEILIESHKNGEFESLDEFVDNLEELIDYSEYSQEKDLVKE